MLKINGIEDYETLPLTKWNIPQPNDGEGRENAAETGKRIFNIYATEFLTVVYCTRRWFGLNTDARRWFY